MKKRLFIAIFVVMCMSILVVAASAAAPVPQKPTLDVDFGTVTTIDGFTPPSQLYVNTDERVLLVDEEGNYVTYPTYYVTKDNATFDFDFSKLNAAQSVQYAKKSVVMVEIPDGVTTISASYFAGTGNFPVCVSVQFPGSVTSYGGNLFGSYNNVIKVVEFLDGTEPITMGDSMFGSQWNGGAGSLIYVKFPNNLVSIGKNTFGKAFNLKTVILGENLEKIGTGFFSESSPSGSEKFVYASDKFFANSNDMFNNLFGEVNQWNNKQINIKLFYVGSKDKAETLVEAGKALQSGYIFDNVHYFDASTYNYETDKVGGYNNISIIYNYGKCDAFYNGVHNTVQQNPCVNACTNCGLGTIKHADATAETVTVSYANGFINAGSKHVVCSNANCGYDVTVDLPAILQTNGYSVPENGEGRLLIAFTVDKEALAEYEQANNEAIKYGAFAIAYSNITDSEIIETTGVVTTEVDREYAAFEFVISGFATDTQKEAKITFGAYTVDKNGKVEYQLPNQPAEGDKYSYVTYNQIDRIDASFCYVELLPFSIPIIWFLRNLCYRKIR